MHPTVALCTRTGALCTRAAEMAPPQAAASQHHSSDIRAPQSGHGTSQPTVVAVGSSASTSQAGHVHQLVALISSMGRRVSDTPVIFGMITDCNQAMGGRVTP